jgi:DNA-binding IclR family transcriptional regulator
MKRVRKAGYAVAFGEVTAGAVGIAAPVFDDRGTPIASVCVTITGALVDGAGIDRIAADVKAVANEISAAHADPENS